MCTDVGAGRTGAICVGMCVVCTYKGGELWGWAATWGAESGPWGMGSVYKHVTHVDGPCGEISVSKCLGFGSLEVCVPT